MSWEDFEDVEPCECGRGTITRTTSLNDWGGVRAYTKINCTVCLKKAIERRKIEKIKEENRKRKIDERERKINELERIMIDYFRENYNGQWIEYFDDVKNKKDMWNKSKEIEFMRNSSLTSFYKHCKRFGYDKTAYINNLVSYVNIDRIIVALKIVDDKLEMMNNAIYEAKCTSID